MKHMIAFAALLALAYSQETPEQRRQQLVNDIWNVTAENGCFTREVMQDTFAIMDEDEDNKVTQDEFTIYVGGSLGNKPATCLWGKTSATGGNPITIPDGVNKIFELYKPNGDCVSEENFKGRQITLLTECRWPEDEESKH